MFTFHRYGQDGKNNVEPTQNYVVTAQKTTAVFNSMSGNFSAPDDLNLILDKLFRLEVYLVTSDGLRSLKEIPINGRITIVRKFRMPKEKKDYLFVLTHKFNIFILELKRDGADFDVLTLAVGSIIEKIGYPSESGAACAINPTAQLIALRIFDGIVNVIKMDFVNKEMKTFNVRMDEIHMNDLVFLHGFKTPMLAIIYQDTQSRHLKLYEIAPDEMEFRRGPWKQDNIESEANMLIAVAEPLGGVLVIGQESITYITDQNKYTAIAPPPMKEYAVTCTCPLDATRFLIGDMSGRLFMLLLENNNLESSSITSASVQLKFIFLGDVSIPQCLSYLDNNYIFVGSRFGDSQFVKLNTEANEYGSFIQVVDCFTNLAPIVDMIMVDLDKQGQDQLVTCSGFSKDGSLRIIRNGIGINEHATMQLEGIKGLWALRTDSSPLDSLIVVSFIGLTKLIQLVDEEVAETELNAFNCAEQTVHCANIFQQGNVLILQATAADLRLISATQDQVVSKWVSTEGITLVSTNNTQVLCATRYNLHYFEIIEGQFKLISECRLDYEAACLDITPLNGDTSQFAAISFWENISVSILNLPDLKSLHTEKLGGEIIARSILMSHLDMRSYLFVAIADGSLLYYLLDSTTGAISEKKKVILGTQPTTLGTFISNGTSNIFACSDRPTVIYSSNNKLVFSNVNLKEVTNMCTLNSSAYPNSLIFTTKTALTIGQIDQIQKLHIRTIALGETPRRIAHQPSTQTFGVLTARHDVLGEDGQVVPARNSASCTAINRTSSSSLPSFGKPPTTFSMNEQSEFEIFHLLIIDQNTFKVLHAHQFLNNEFALSITSAKLGDDPNDYYIVGTAFVNSEDTEPKIGRLILFHFTDGKLQQLIEKEIKGAPYCVQEFKGKLLTTINSTIRLYEWTANELRNECTHFNSVVSLFLKTKGDNVIVGDLLRSLSLLTYKSVEGNFESVANDLNTSWLTAVEIIDDDVYLVADNNFNLLMVQKDNTSNERDLDRNQLSTTGYFHLGDFINVFRHGSLVTSHPCEMSCPIPTKPILYGSYSGAIGLIVQIPESYASFLLKLQKNLTKVIKPIGKIDYHYWRSYLSEKKTEPASNFVDGDLIELFLDLSRNQMAECIDDLQLFENGNSRSATVDDVIKIVEELSRIH